MAAPSENLEDRISLAAFVALFPSVTQQQARLVLEQIAQSTKVAVDRLCILFDQGTPVPLRRFLTEHDDERPTNGAGLL